MEYHRGLYNIVCGVYAQPPANRMRPLQGRKPKPRNVDLTLVNCPDRKGRFLKPRPKTSHFWETWGFSVELATKPSPSNTEISRVNTAPHPWLCQVEIAIAKHSALQR